VSVQHVHYIVSLVCVCVCILYIHMIRCCTATRPVCGGSNKPPRVQPVISRQSALYCIYYIYTDARVYVYLRPTVRGDKNRTDLSGPVRTGTQGRTRFIEIRSGLREVCANCVRLRTRVRMCVRVCVLVCYMHYGRNFSDSKFNTEN